MANRRQASGNRSFPHNSMTSHPWQSGMGPQLGLQHFISQLNDSQVSGLAVALSNMYRGPMQGSQHPPSLLAMPPRYAPGGLTSFRQQYGRINRSVEGRRFGATKIQSRQTRSTSSQSKQRKTGGTGGKGTSMEKTTSNKKKKQNKNKSGVKSEEKKNGDGGDENNDENNDDKIVNDDDTKDEEGGEKKNDDKKKNGNGNKDGKYSGIPVQYLKCIVCDKSMWDGESFEKHLRGRAHKQMFESVEDSHKIQADMMRQTIRLAEERKSIELNRMKRLGKRVDFRKGTHCAMCDYNFYGQETAHRKSDGHQKLKQFLHPRCKRCRLDFTTRIDWEEHRLTPEHLIKRVNARENNGGKGVEVVKTTTVEGEENAETNENTENGAEGTPTEPEPELSIHEIRKNFLLDVNEETDFLKDFKIRVPPYRKSRAVGPSFLIEQTGHICNLCDQFFMTKQTQDIHLKSRGHYDKYIAFIKKAHDDKVKEVKKDENNKVVAEENGDVQKVLENGADLKDVDAFYDPMEADDDVLIVEDDDNNKGRKKNDNKDNIPKEFWHQVDKDIDMILDDTTTTTTSTNDDTTTTPAPPVTTTPTVKKEDNIKEDDIEGGGTPRATSKAQRTKTKSGSMGKARGNRT